MGSYANKYLVSKKLAAVGLLFFVAWSVGLALVVYYGGVAQSDTDTQVEDSSSSSSAQVKASQLKEKVTDVRLPRHLEPEQYDLKLTPFIIPDNWTINGYVEISMLCKSDGNNVTLHSTDIEIENKTVTLQDENGASLQISRYSYDHDREFFILHLAENLVKGHRYTVKIKFTSFLKDNLKGFYRSEYTDQESRDEKKYLAVTQFQPTDARRAFPCFDEPGIKAKFKVSLGRRTDMSSISNMPIREKGVAMDGDNEYVWDLYDNSVKMSTYLVAFVVSKFEFRESEKSDNGVRFRIWSRKDAMQQTEYARDIGPKMLKFFEDYFQVPFPLPKQDMIAAPDFAAGAMENWGLITYRETSLLFKPGVSAASNLQRIALVISHELAHQWFGNLVTPSWWSDLWLNEGFASYIEYLGVEAVQPQIQLLEQFIVNDLQDVLSLDALQSSHPISIPVKHPDEINEIFDRISYGKGASIIRMMDKFLTSGTFKQGLTNYLRAFQFDSAEQDDLWKYLTEQGHRDGTLRSDLTVKQVMDTWTLQTGFPLLTVNRNYEAGTAKISQERFLLNQTQSSESRWWVPVTYTRPGGDFNNTYNNVWLSDKQWSRQLNDMPAKDTASIFNIQQTGFYRVNYDKKNWELIAETLKNDHKSIHVINRAQILDDALELAKVGKLDYQTALSLTGYLSKETEYIAWYSALSGLSHIQDMLKRTSAYGEFKSYMLKLLAPIYQKLGFQGKSDDQHLDILLRKKIVSWACSMGHEDCVDKVTTTFKNWMFMTNPDAEEKNPIDVNLKGLTYCNAIAEGGEKEWDFAWKRYENSNVGSEKANILYALGCTEQVWLLNRYLNMSLTSGSGVRRQDGSKVIGSVARNTVGRYLAFNFLRDKWDLIKNYWTGFSAVGNTVKAISKSFNTKFDLNELEDFQKAHQGDLGTSDRAVKQAIEAGLGNVHWMEQNYENVWNWLKDYNQENKRG
jgi:aminopeptidase N